MTTDPTSRPSPVALRPGDLVTSTRDLHRWLPFGFVASASPGRVVATTWLRRRLVVDFRGHSRFGNPRPVTLVVRRGDLAAVVAHTPSTLAAWRAWRRRTVEGGSR